MTHNGWNEFYVSIERIFLQKPLAKMRHLFSDSRHLWKRKNFVKKYIFFALSTHFRHILS